MTPRRVARRVVAGAGAAVLLAAGVLAAEVGYTATRQYLPAEAAPAVAGTFGVGTSAAPVSLLLLGDSTAAGVGASSTEATVGGRLAAALAAGRQVTLSSAAVSGSRVADLRAQITGTLDGVTAAPTLAVILVGANDATHLTSLGTVRSRLAAAVRRLHDAGSAVVVAGCPDLGAARAFPQPLRLLAAARGRAVAARMRSAAADTGASYVDLARSTGPTFRRDPRMLSSDRFHPSDRGYAEWARALLPAVAAELA